MCGKGNSGFEKEKFVLLSPKKNERKGNEKEQKERSMKKSSNKTRSTNNENWDEFGGGLCFLKENFVKEWLWWNVFIYLKIFELLYPILSIN